MPNYSMMSGMGGQRDAITRALMNIAMPPPATSTPGQYGVTQGPQVPGVQGPIVPAAGQPGMQQDPMAAQSPVQAPGAGALGGMSGQPGQPGQGMAGGVPLSPRQIMPQAPGMGQAGLPAGPMPNTPNLVGQPLPVQPPGSQINPPLPGAGGSQLGGY